MYIRCGTVDAEIANGEARERLLADIFARFEINSVVLRWMKVGPDFK